MSYQLRKREKKNVPYSFLPVDSEDEFQKAQSSNHSRFSKRTSRGFAMVKQREVSEFHMNQRPDHLSVQYTHKRSLACPSLSKSIFPLGNPPIWNTECLICPELTDQIAGEFGINHIFSNQIDNIYLIPGDESKSQYIVEYIDTRLEKHTTKTLQEKHLKEFVGFLQKAVFENKK